MRQRARGHSLHRWVDDITALFLVLAGAVGISVEIAHVFGFEEFVVKSHDSAVLLAVLGLIAVALGVERLLRFRAIEESIEELATLNKSTSECRLLKGADEIYSSATLPVNRAERHFRALLSLEPTKAPVSFAEALAHRLHESLKAGNPIRNDVVFAVNAAMLSPEFFARLEERFQVYVRAGVGHLVSRFMIDTNTTAVFDMFIVDHSWATISFPTISSMSSPQASLVFEDQKIVAELVDWFDQRVLRSARPLSEFWDHGKPSGESPPRS